MKTTLFNIALCSMILSHSAVAANSEALVHKGIQAWGFIQQDEYNNNNNTGIVFKWDNKTDKYVTQPSIEPEKMIGGKSCDHNISNTKSLFKINPNATLNRTAQVNNITGTTTMTGFNPGTGNTTVGDLYPEGGSNTEQKTVFNSDGSVFAYGMFAAGGTFLDSTPIDGQDQAYAYYTGSVQTWMSDLRNQNTTQWDNSTLDKVVLPGAHDAGMWNLPPSVNTPSAFVEYLNSLKPKIGNNPFVKLLLGVTSSITYNSIQSFSLTQKDTPSDAMKAGIRYFDFRPAKTVTGLKVKNLDDQYYHIHSFVPGQNFQDFLSQATTFLNNNPHEIIVVNVKDSGIQTAAFTPLYSTSADLSAATTEVQTLLKAINYDTKDAIYTNTYSDIKDMTLGDLYTSNQRLIFYFGTDYNDSYTANPSLYQTYQPKNVVTALGEALSKCPNSTSHYSVFQMQDTASVYIENHIVTTGNQTGSTLTSSNGSILMSTKGMFDNQTYPWASQSLGRCPTLSVMLNDYAGNLLSTMAKRLTSYKMKLSTAQKVISNGGCTLVKHGSDDYN